MENKELLTGNNERTDSTPENELPLPLYEVPTPPLTALEFEIGESEQPDLNVRDASDNSVTEKPTVTETDVAHTEEVKTETKKENEKNRDPHEDEFLIPESYITDKDFETQTFVNTPASIRPTYLPRFTEVSDTYRMQNDPRPRTDAPKPATKVVENKEEEINLTDLDPTSEGVENKEVEKVVVSSGTPVNKDLTDENLTVLKFSTPIDTQTQDALSVLTENDAPVQETPAVVNDDMTVVEENIDEVTNENEESVKEQGPLTIPDPETTYSVVNFAPDQERFESDMPLGSEESPIKEQKKGEFTSPIQRDSIKDRALDSLMSIRVRLVCVALLLATVVIMDCVRWFGFEPLSSVGLASIPSAATYVDMQFAVCMFLLAIPEAVRSCSLLLKKTLSPELFIVAALPVIVVNDIILAANGAEGFLTFSALYGLQCFSAILAYYIKIDTDFLAFKSVSKNIGKNVLDKRFTRELPRENLALDGIIDEYNSKTARMFRTSFVSGFFRRSSVLCENSSNVAMILGVGTGLSLVTSLVSFFLNSYSIVHAAQSFATVFLLSLPVFSIFLHKLPYKQSMREVIEKDEGAYIGESSIYESADVDVVTYEDTEIFGTEDVRIKKVHLYGKAYNTAKAMKQMYSLFSVVGGPLDYVFSSSLDRKCPSATEIVIEPDGICGMLEGHRIFAGTAEYMARHGVTIPSDDYRTNSSTVDSTRVMYGAEDNEVYVKFFIRYSFSEEFTMILPELKEKKIVPLIYTRDPNITGDLLKILTLGEDIIRVMKKYVPRTTEEQTYRHIDSGLVTYGDKTNAINMILLAKKYTALQSGFAVYELIAMVVGAVLAVIISMGEFFAVPEILLPLWHVLWCVFLKVSSKIGLSSRTAKDEELEEEEENIQ